MPYRFELGSAWLEPSQTGSSRFKPAKPFRDLTYKGKERKRQREGNVQGEREKETEGGKHTRGKRERKKERKIY